MRNAAAILFAIATAACGLLTAPEERCGDFALGSGSLEGRISYLDDRPFAHAAITLGMNHQTETDANGFFRFSDVSAGTYPLRAVEDASLLRGELQITRDRNFVRIVIPNAVFSGFAAGRVLDACNGLPIAGAHIGWPDQSITTDADGTYVRGACCNSEFGVMVWKEGYRPEPFSGSRISGGTELRDYTLMRLTVSPSP